MTTLLERSARARDLGPRAHRATRIALVLAALFLGVTMQDPLPSCVFVGLLLVPRGFLLIRLLKTLNPTVLAGILGMSVLFVPLLEGAIRGSIGSGFSPYQGLAHAAMILAVFKDKQARLESRDHNVLLVISLFVVLMGLSGVLHVWLKPIFMLWGISCAAALVAVHLAREEHRVMDVARLRGGDRDDAEQIGGRIRSNSPGLRRMVLLLGFWLVCGGFLLAWLLPLAASGVGGLLGTDAGEGAGASGGGDGEGGEDGDGPPEFAIPPGEVGLGPFGNILDRPGFVERAELDELAMLVRGGEGGMTLVRGECYDFLDSRGRWIRSQAREWEVHDAQDGVSDGKVRLGEIAGRSKWEEEYLVPPGSDRTIYRPTGAIEVGIPVVARDGVGNLLLPRGRWRTPRYIVGGRAIGELSDAELLDVGPEYFLLPKGIRADRLATAMRPVVYGARSPLERIHLVREHLRRKYLNLDEPPLAPEDSPVAGPPPENLDVNGFLFTRYWGNNLDFATGFAALLRSLAIPCRLATGYRNGESEEGSDFLVYRGWHTYAWVEVRFAHYGWVPFDATPEQVLDIDLPEMAEIFELPPEERAEAAARLRDRPPAAPGPLERLEDYIANLIGSRTLGRIVMWVAILVTGTLLVLLLGFAGDKGRRLVFGDRGGPKRAAAVAFYDRLLEILKSDGNRRRASQTPVEFARSVVEARGDAYADIGRITNAFCVMRYGERTLAAGAQEKLMERVETIGVSLATEREARRRTGGKILAGLLLVGLGLFGSPAVAQEAGTNRLIEDLGHPDSGTRSAARRTLAARGNECVPDLVRALVGRPAGVDENRLRRLIAELDADSFVVRERAAEELRQIGLPARPALEKAAAEGSPEVRRSAGRLLRHFREELEPAEKNRRRQRLAVKEEVILLIGRLGGATELDPLVQAALTWPELRGAAVSALRSLGGRAPVALAALLDRADRDVRRLAGEAAIGCSAPPLLERLRVLTQDDDPILRAAARRALVTSDLVEKAVRARILVDSGVLDSAESLLREILGACPGYVEAGILRARVHGEKGEFSQARRLIEGLDLPDAEKSMLLARIHFREESRESALACLVSARQAAPGHTGAHLLAIRILLSYRLPRIRKALDLAHEAVKESGRDPETWAALGRVYGEHLDSLEEAYECFLKAARLAPGEKRYRAGMKRYSGR